MPVEPTAGRRPSDAGGGAAAPASSRGSRAIIELAVTDDTCLPVEEQELLADTWIQALELLAEGDPEAGQELLRRGIRRARELEAPWQGMLLGAWQALQRRFPPEQAPLKPV